MVGRSVPVLDSLLMSRDISNRGVSSSLFNRSSPDLDKSKDTDKEQDSDGRERFHAVI